MLTQPDKERIWISIGPGQFFPELHAAGATNAVDTTWPTANLAMLLPIYIRTRVIAWKMWWNNGATITANADIGLYDETGTVKLFSSGSTAMAGSGNLQTVTINPSGMILTAGRYWGALALSTNTGQIKAWSGGLLPGNLSKFLGMQQMAAAFPLPSVLTFAAAANAMVPSFGLYCLNLTM